MKLLRKHRARRKSAIVRNGNPIVSIVGISFGLILVILSVLYVAGAYQMVRVLAEIEHKDFSPANLRIAGYQTFFERLEKDGFAVQASSAYIKEGVKYFLWVVSTPDGKSRLIYRWKHDLQTNKVEPLTSPATYLDIELGHIPRGDADAFPYAPGDELAEEIAKGTYEVETPATSADVAESEAGAENEVTEDDKTEAKGGTTEEEAEPGDQETEEKQEKPADDGEGRTEEVEDGEENGESEGEAIDVGGKKNGEKEEGGEEENGDEEEEPPKDEVKQEEDDARV